MATKKAGNADRIDPDQLTSEARQAMNDMGIDVIDFTWEISGKTRINPRPQWERAKQGLESLFSVSKKRVKN